MENEIRGEALSLWRSVIRPDDRILITGSSGWLGRTALAMARDSRVPVLATGSQDKVISLDGIEQVVRSQDIELMADFRPTIVIDTAFLTREKLKTYGHTTYVKVNQKLLQDSQALAQLPTVRKYVGFSSGAAVHLAGMESFSLAQNPYSAQKREYETTMANIDARHGCDVAIARVWSVSGAYMTKPSSFAISNLIQQAKSGIIEIRSSGPVYRRYCAIEDVISVGLATQSAPGKRIFDTGGDLIELGELAEIIGEEISPKIQIVRKFKPMLRSDSYHSDGEDWRMLSQRFDLGFDSIPNQVARLARFIN